MDNSFEKVYTEYYTPVYRYILSMCKDSLTAEEITQETFFKALKNIEKYDPSKKMLTWLCTIAKNTYLTGEISFEDYETHLIWTAHDVPGE